ncbi:MAG: phosphate acyltransferase PlsX [Anaerolineae bacterium]
MTEKIRVALDAMGGDRAPQVTIEGAIVSVHELPDISVVLVGNEPVIRKELARFAKDESDSLSVIHAPEVVAMDEAPANAVRAKPGNSMSVGMRLVKDGHADAFVTAGNTGAALAAALFELGRIRGIRRPALATVLPGLGSHYLILDIGANADCRPMDLVQFAFMGHVYSKQVLGITSPRIGLVSNGEEEGKGNQLVKETFPLLRDSGLRFIGNVEGKDLPYDVADVVVTDGFTGNIMIKTAEGIAALILDTVRGAATSSLRGKLGGLLLRPALKKALVQLDYTEVGGAPLLGVAGAVIIGHGRSNSKAIVSMIRAGANVARQDVVGAIRSGLGDITVVKDQLE